MARLINDGVVTYGATILKIGGNGKRRRRYVCGQICISTAPNKISRGKGLIQYSGFKAGSMVVRMLRPPRRSFLGLNFRFNKEAFYIDNQEPFFIKDREIAFGVTFRKIYS